MFIKRLGNVNIEWRYVYKMIEKHKAGDDENRRKTLKRTEDVKREYE